MAEGYSKAMVQSKQKRPSLPEARLHHQGVNEEIRGARRNIKLIKMQQAISVHKYLQGAKAMAKHVSMGGTPMTQLVSLTEYLQRYCRMQPNQDM